MVKVRTSLHPNTWARKFAIGQTPRLQDNSVIKWERFDFRNKPEPKDFEVNDYSRRTFESPHQNDNAMKRFDARTMTNEELAKRFCSKFNHKYRLRRINPRTGERYDELVGLTIALNDYQNSLASFNLCYGCNQPIVTHRHSVTYIDANHLDCNQCKFDSNGVLSTPCKSHHSIVSEEVADIPSYAELYQDTKGKMRYRITQPIRIFATRCACPVSEHRAQSQERAKDEKLMPELETFRPWAI